MEEICLRMPGSMSRNFFVAAYYIETKNKIYILKGRENERQNEWGVIFCTELVTYKSNSFGEIYEDLIN